MNVFWSSQRCRSITFWGGSGSGSADPCLWLLDSGPAIFVIDLPKMSTKNKFFKKFLLITVWRYMNIIFKDKKSKRSHKSVGFKVFLTFFAWWYKDPDPYLTEGSGSGSRMPQNMWIRGIRIRSRIRNTVKLSQCKLCENVKGKCLKTKVLDESPASLSASRMTKRLLLLSSGGTTTLIF